MKILNVAYPLLPVGPGSAGGAEQILYLLDGGLVERGIESVVIAAEGSQVSGRLWPTPPARDDITETERAYAQRFHKCTIENVLASEQIDLIHFHGLDFGAYMPDSRIVKAATLHLPIPWYEAGSLEKHDVNLVAVSKTQAAAAKA